MDNRTNRKPGNGFSSSQEERKKAALYVRVSTSYQVDKDSLPMQKKDLIAYAELVLGITEYEIFEDAGYSGKNMERPAFQKMMSMIRAGGFTHLLVWKIDRVSRNLLDFATMYQELKNLDVIFVSKNEQFDTSTAMGEAMLKIILVFAELERNMTSERVLATMLSRANSGLWNGGRVPYGYGYNYDTKEFFIDESEGKLAVMIHDLYEKHRSLVRVSRMMNEMGYKTRAGNDWNPVSVLLILRSVFNCGDYRYNYTSESNRQKKKKKEEWVVIKDHHPAIVSWEQKGRIWNILDENARLLNMPGQQSNKKNVHIFAGLCHCGHCGHPMNATPSNRQASGYRPSKYGCPMRRQTNKCDSKFISDPVLGEFMINYILNLMNAQKDFRNVHSPEELGKRLLHGSTFDDVASIDNDGLEELFRVLSEYSGENSEFLKKPSVNKSGDSENEIRKLREEKKKTERALDRLKRIYLYSDEAISEKEFLIEKKALTDHLEEVNESLGMVEKDSWNLNMTDADFIAQASSFIISQQLQDREYIYFKKLHMSTDPAVLKEFFRSIVDSITIYNGRVDCIVFRNGLSQQFSYKEESQGC